MYLHTLYASMCAICIYICTYVHTIHMYNVISRVLNLIAEIEREPSAIFHKNANEIVTVLY